MSSASVGLKSRRRLWLAAAACLAATSSFATAGPYADFERALATAYAPYRAALMQSNQKDKAGTEASLRAFETGWARLVATYRSAPPPQYADDPDWTATVSAIDEIIAAAKVDAAKGDLSKVHEVLEGVRDRLGELRSRNGVITLSDRLDAYHEKMEHVLTAKPGATERAGALREDAAVLHHLVGLVERYAPAGVKGDAAFKESLAALAASVKSLQEAARSGDSSAIEKALKGSETCLCAHLRKVRLNRRCAGDDDQYVHCAKLSRRQ